MMNFYDESSIFLEIYHMMNLLIRDITYYLRDIINF